MTATICAWCTAYSTMLESGDVLIVDQDEQTEELQAQRSFSCSHCHKLSIGTLWSDPGTSTPVAKSKEFWSAHESDIRWTPENIGGRKFPDVPSHISSAADEAFQCASIGARRAAILLARGVVEATAKDKSIDKGQLHQKIEAMHTNGIIRSFTRDAAHELRFLGNDMAHGDFIDTVEAEDCNAVLEVMAEILSEVYQGPARVVRMRAKRNKVAQDPSS